MKIDAQDITGERFAFNLTGLPARVFQHEYDHLLVIPWHPLVLLLQFTCFEKIHGNFWGTGRQLIFGGFTV